MANTGNFNAMDNITGQLLNKTLQSEISMPCLDVWCIVQTLCIGIITVLIIVTNFVDIIVICFSFDVFDTPEYFMLSLAGADLGVGILVTPFSIQSSVFKTWLYGDEWCAVTGTLAALFCSVSIYSLVLISIERYLKIMYPLRSPVLTKSKCLILIGLIWAACMCIFGTYKYVVNQFYFDHKSYICSTDFPNQWKFTVFIVLTVVVPSLIVLCVIYKRIYFTAQRHHLQIIQLYKRDSSISQKSKQSAVSILKSPQWKNTKMYVFIIGGFFFAWLPYSFLQLLLCLTDYLVPQPVVFVILWTAMANSFWNTIIYFVMHRKYRQGFVKIWKYITLETRFRIRGIENKMQIKL